MSEEEDDDKSKVGRRAAVSQNSLSTPVPGLATLSSSPSSSSSNLGMTEDAVILELQPRNRGASISEEEQTAQTDYGNSLERETNPEQSVRSNNNDTSHGATTFSKTSRRQDGQIYDESSDRNEDTSNVNTRTSNKESRGGSYGHNSEVNSSDNVDTGSSSEEFGSEVNCSDDDNIVIDNDTKTALRSATEATEESSDASGTNRQDDEDPNNTSKSSDNYEAPDEGSSDNTDTPGDDKGVSEASSDHPSSASVGWDNCSDSNGGGDWRKGFTAPLGITTFGYYDDSSKEIERPNMKDLLKKYQRLLVAPIEEVLSEFTDAELVQFLADLDRTFMVNWKMRHEGMPVYPMRPITNAYFSLLDQSGRRSTRKILGAGSFGIVIKAIGQVDKETVAVKQVSVLADDEQELNAQMEATQQEGRILILFREVPHILQYRDMMVAGGIQLPCYSPKQKGNPEPFFSPERERTIPRASSIVVPPSGRKSYRAAEILINRSIITESHELAFATPGKADEADFEETTSTSGSPLNSDSDEGSPKLLTAGATENSSIRASFSSRDSQEGRFSLDSSSNGSDVTDDADPNPKEDAVWRGDVFIVTEFCDEGTLDDYIIWDLLENTHCPNEKLVKARSKTMNLQKNFWRWLLNSAEALKEIHDKGVVHRDHKPENWMLKKVRDCLEIKIGDFGMSCLLGEGFDTIAPTTTKETIGSFFYGSPELLNARPHGKSTDVYSFGMSWLQLIFFDRKLDKVPYEELRYMREVSTDEDLKVPLFWIMQLHKISCIDPDCKLYRLLRKAISEDPDRRPTMSEICQTLQEIISQQTRNPRSNSRLLDSLLLA